MASPVEVTLILCDAASADPMTGKVHMLGAGWSVTPTPTPPQALAVLVKVPWDRTNQRIPLVLNLLNGDGQEVRINVSGVPEPQGVSISAELEVGRPAGLAPGSTIDQALAINIPSMPLPPGRYQWRLEVSDQAFATSFEVRLPPQQVARSQPSGS